MNTFINDNTKKRVQKCKDFYEDKIDKVQLTTDDLQAYAIYATAVNAFKDTKYKATKKYNKDLENLELKLEEVAKEINEQIRIRAEQQEEQKRIDKIEKLKTENQGIAYNIKRIERAIAKEDQCINREDIVSLDKTLARR